MRVIVAWIACGKNVQDPGDVSRSEATVLGRNIRKQIENSEKNSSRSAWSSQKSILRDAVMALLSMDFYAKLVLCVMFPQGQIHVCIVCVCVCVCSCVLLSLQASAIDIAELDISVQSALA